MVALFFLAIGGISGGWYLVNKFAGQGAGHIQSAVLAAASVTIGLILFMLGFLADLSSVNRRLLERIDWRLRQLENEARSASGRSATESTGVTPQRDHAA
jgi:hypothetical protein